MVLTQEVNMTSRTIGLLVTLALAILVTPLAADAPQVTTVHRVGRLIAGNPPAGPDPSLDAFRQGLRDLGYVEGQNLVMEHRSAEGSTERLPHLAAELVRLPVEVLVVQGAAAIHAAQQATRTIPIVMVTISDAVAQGFAASLARPGSNITGLAGLAPELSRKRLEFLKETVPHLSRVAVLVNPANRVAGPADMDNLTEASRVLGLHLHILELRSPNELDHAFPAMTREGAEALLVIPDSLVIDGLHSRIVALAATHRLPAMYPWKMCVEAGGLMSYAQSLSALWQRAAYYVDRIMKGAKPADLPIEQPTTFELVINLKTAQSLGITFPPGLLMLADEVIQ
jgi:putative tryptophan/tyrosine transport system substrate-binding protein